jgi:hypothetical protein
MTSVPTNSQLPISQVLLGSPACEGRKSITTIIDFSIGLSFQLDLSAIQTQQKWINSVQTLYVDNSHNASAIDIVMGVSLQHITIPAGAQAYMPILQPNPPVLNFTNTLPVTVKIQILNFFVPPIVWGAGGVTQEVSDPILDATVSNNRVNTTSLPTTLTGVTDASGTITAGGTAQQVLAANASRNRFIIANPDTATDTLYMSFGSGASGEIPLQPGMIWDESGSSIVGEAIFLKGATTGDAFTLYSE